MSLFYFAQIIPVVPKFEWNCFNYPNLIDVVEIYPNDSNFTYILLKFL